MPGHQMVNFSITSYTPVGNTACWQGVGATPMSRLIWSWVRRIGELRGDSDPNVWILAVKCLNLPCRLIFSCFHSSDIDTSPVGFCGEKL